MDTKDDFSPFDPADMEEAGLRLRSELSQAEENAVAMGEKFIRSLAESGVDVEFASNMLLELSPNIVAGNQNVNVTQAERDETIRTLIVKAMRLGYMLSSDGLALTKSKRAAKEGKLH